MKQTLKDVFARWRRALNTAPVALGGRPAELRLPRGWPERDPSVYWWSPAADAAGARAGHAENLAHLPAAVRAAPIHVWTPAAETLLTRARLPTRSRAHVLQALPFALEDQLLDEPEQLHFAYVREADGALAVAVTQRARLNTWLDILKGAGVRPASLSPANLALPLYPQAWSAAFVDDELWVRSGEHAGFVSVASREPPPLLVAALKEAAAQDSAPQQLIIYTPPPRFDADAWNAALQLPMTIDPSDFWQAAKRPALNLLQADFGHAAHARQVLRPLRPAAIMLAVWIVALLAIDAAEWLRLRQAHNAYTTEMHRIFQQSFPEVRTVLDPAVQMERQLESLQSRGGGPADLVPLLSRIAPALQAQRPRVKLHAIKYSERSLTLELALPDYQALDAMKNALQAANLDVEVLAATGRGNEVDGRLRVQPAGAKAATPRQRS